MLSLNYDKQYDVLYLGIGDNSNSYCSDETDSLNIFKDLVSDEITGFVIFSFMEKYKENKLPIISSPVKVNYDYDVIPYL